MYSLVSLRGKNRGSSCRLCPLLRQRTGFEVMVVSTTLQAVPNRPDRTNLSDKCRHARFTSSQIIRRLLLPCPSCLGTVPQPHGGSFLPIGPARSCLQTRLFPLSSPWKLHLGKLELKGIPSARKPSLAAEEAGLPGEWIRYARSRRCWSGVFLRILR